MKVAKMLKHHHQGHYQVKISASLNSLNIWPLKAQSPKKKNEMYVQRDQANVAQLYCD